MGICSLLGQPAVGPINLLQLQLILSRLNVPIGLLAGLLGVLPGDIGAATVTFDDLLAIGITREQLDAQGITLDELERIGIDVSTERRRRDQKDGDDEQ
jgi:hypothetical protein